MSEFQYYEFRTIDRALTAIEKAEINTWSSRAKASNHKVTFNYSYSDFPKNDEHVMFQYFDAMLYWVNFGCKKVMLRFPLSLVNKKELLAYTFSDNIEIKTNGEYLLLIIAENVEDGGYEDWFEEEDSSLSDMIGIREEIMKGDYRSLYLAWLYFHSSDHKGYFPEDYYESEEEEDLDEEQENRLLAVEPALPANLGSLSPADVALCTFLGLSEDWIAAAAAHSPKTNEVAIDYAQLIAQLSESEKNDFLLRLAHQEGNLSTLFLQKLQQFLPKKKKTSEVGRSIQEIEEIVAEKRSKRLQTEKEVNLKESLRIWNDTHTHRKTIWHETARLLALRTANGYEGGAKNIQKLYEAAKYYKELGEYQIRFREVVAPYKSSSAFVKRIKHLPYTEWL